MALFYLDQLYHPKGDTIRKFGGTQSLFIQYFLGGFTCLAMVYVCYCNDCNDNKSSKLNRNNKNLCRQEIKLQRKSQLSINKV